MSVRITRGALFTKMSMMFPSGTGQYCRYMFYSAEPFLSGRFSGTERRTGLKRCA